MNNYALAVCPDKLNQIKNKIKEIEKQKDILVIHSCLVGSRSLGIHNKNSDYDVRLVYIDRPDWYFELKRGNDCFVEYDDDLDIVGYGLHKSFKSIVESNATFHEWMRSKLIIETYDVPMISMRRLCEEFYNPLKVHYHYSSIFRKSVSKIQVLSDKNKATTLTPEMVKLFSFTVRTFLDMVNCYNPYSFDSTIRDKINMSNIPLDVKEMIHTYFDLIETFNGIDLIKHTNKLMGRLIKLECEIDASMYKGKKIPDVSKVTAFHRELVIRRLGVK